MIQMFLMISLTFALAFFMSDNFVSGAVETAVAAKAPAPEKIVRPKKLSGAEKFAQGLAIADKIASSQAVGALAGLASRGVGAIQEFGEERALEAGAEQEIAALPERQQAQDHGLRPPPRVFLPVDGIPHRVA